MDTIYIKNARRSPCHSIRLRKVDGCCRWVGLMGAVFDLLKYDDATGCYRSLKTGLMTDQQGFVVVDHLDIGRYKFTEAKAPAGVLHW